MAKRISVGDTLAKQSPAKNLVVKPPKEQPTTPPSEQFPNPPKELKNTRPSNHNTESTKEHLNISPEIQKNNESLEHLTEKSNDETTELDLNYKLNISPLNVSIEKSVDETINQSNNYFTESTNDQSINIPNNQTNYSPEIQKNESPKERKNRSSDKQNNKTTKDEKSNSPLEQSTEEMVDPMMEIVRASFDIEFGLRLAVKISAPLYGVSMSQLVHDALAIHLSKMEKIRGSEYHRLQAEVPEELPMRKRLEDLGY